MNWIEFYAKATGVPIEEAQENLDLQRALANHETAFIRNCMTEYEKHCRMAADLPAGDLQGWALQRGKAEAFFDLAAQTQRQAKFIEDLFLQYQSKVSQEQEQ